MSSRALLGPSLLVTVSILLTSGIWIGAYFIGVKPHIDKKNDNNCPSQPNSINNNTCSLPNMPKCENTCRLYLCESMPDALSISSPHNSTTQCWMHILNSAQNNVKIGSYYWSLRYNDTNDYPVFKDPRNSTGDGAQIYNGILATAARNVKFQIAQNIVEDGYDEGTTLSTLNPNIKVRSLDFDKLIGAGIIHTKSWVADSKHFYVGSANFDWRSLRQVKELGVLGVDCPCLAQDVEKIIDNYWDAGSPEQKLPSSWPSSRSVSANFENRYSVPLPSEDLSVFFSSSPPQLNACGRENDIDAMIKIIDSATSFVHLAVMDYIPATLYLKQNFYYPLLDDAIRRAAFRRVKVKFMLSKWSHTSSDFFGYMHSMASLNGSLPCIWEEKYINCQPGTAGQLEVRIFQLPPDGEITDKMFARVQHTKYFVTEDTAYIGTSNWSADYWTDTAGIGVVMKADNVKQTAKIVKEVQDLYMRDWNSPYSTDISHFDNKGNRIPM